MKANIVITFGNGNVEEYGDPEELIEKDTKFKEFVKRIPIYGKP
jgi:ABC-type multidrug transport system fused ATPase/permease subunit